MSSLRVLNLEGNQIAVLPEAVAGLTRQGPSPPPVAGSAARAHPRPPAPAGGWELSARLLVAWRPAGGRRLVPPGRWALETVGPRLALPCRLEELNLSNNALGSLPPRLGLMPALRALLVEGNCLRTIRRPILERGTPALLDYLRSRMPVE